jgi:hypothetical protein
MAGLKVTLNAAMRARDVSRPTAAQESDAELALPDRLAARRPPMSSPLPEPGPEQPPRDKPAPPRPAPPRPAPPRLRRAPGRRPFRPGGAAADTPQEDNTAAPDSPDLQTPDAPDRHPRMRRRNRLGRLADNARRDPSGDPGAEVTRPGPPSDQGSGGNSPVCS